MELEYYLQDCDLKLPNKEQLSIWIEETIENEGKEAGVLSVIFCSDDYLLEINKKYLNHDYYTDIITFDYVDAELIGAPISGDLFISIDTVGRNAFEYKVQFKTELHRVIIHGILHLLGYKDKTSSESLEMRTKEDFYLERLNLIPRDIQPSEKE